MYVYRHIRLDTNKVFYIGIGSRKDRATSKQGRNNYWTNIVNKHGYKIEIIAENLEPDDAKELEIFLISLYGREDLKTGILVNMTDGGDIRQNFITSEETRLKMSRAGKGRTQSKEWVAKRSSHFKGVPLSEETKEKLSNAQKGKKASDETKLKLSLFQKNRIYTDEDKKIIGDRTKRLFSKKIINILTGEIFDSILLAALSINMKRSTLNAQLLGINKNKTNFRYLEEYEQI